MFSPKQLTRAQKILKEIQILIEWVRQTSSVSTNQLFEMDQIEDNFYKEFIYKNIPEFNNKKNI